MREELSHYNAIRASVREALIALCVEYAWRADNYQTETIPELFTEDGVWESAFHTMTGKQGLVEGWTARAQLGKTLTRRHLCSNFRFIPIADGRVRGWHALTYFQAPRGENVQPSVTLVGEYEDVFENVRDETWLFKSRRMISVFPSSWASPPPGRPDREET